MLKLLIELGPLVLFFIGYKTGGILTATLYMLVASIISFIALYISEKKINKVNLISTMLIFISASLTIFSGNPMFIKMKPTVLYCLFSFIFCMALIKGKSALRYVLGHTITLKEEKNWLHLDLRFMIFFLAMAICNEIVWRSFDETTWVNFKVFGAMPITLAFIMLQIPYIMKHKQP